MPSPARIGSIVKELVKFMAELRSFGEARMVRPPGRQLSVAQPFQACALSIQAEPGFGKAQPPSRMCRANSLKGCSTGWAIF